MLDGLQFSHLKGSYIMSDKKRAPRRGRRMVKLFAVPTAALALALAVVGGSLTAAADEVSTESCLSAGVKGAHVCFDSWGDHMRVKDTAADGYRAVADWSVSKAGHKAIYGECHNTKGKNTVRDCNYNFREGSRVCVRAEVRNGSKVIRKGDIYCGKA